MRLQRTIKNEAALEGIGLHTGVQTAIRLAPAPADTGVVFWRKDRNVLIKADSSSVTDTAFATTLGSNNSSSVTRIKTVEHLMASLAGLGIDNLIVEVKGPEIPIMDGSAHPFVELILKAGIVKQPAPRRFIKITRPIEFREGNSEICAFPNEGTLITYQTQYKHKLLGSQRLSIRLDEESFVKELASARTFGFLKDVELMRANGLAKGGSLDNAVLFDDSGVMNEGGLRFADECIRHKTLDLVGDLSLAGYPIMGHIVAMKTGHSTNVKFVKALLASPECWELAALEALSPMPALSFQPNLL